MKNLRPDSVSIIGLFEIMISPLGLLFALVWILLSAAVLGGIFLFFSLIWLVSGLGLLNARRWSWNFGMGTAIISLAGSFFLALVPFFRILSPAGLIYWPLVIYKLTRPQVKSFLGKGIRTKTSSEPVADEY